MFYPEGLVDFALEKSFIPKLPFFLLHRCVQKWLFAKYCPHFSFITLLIITKTLGFILILDVYDLYNMKILKEIFKCNFSITQFYKSLVYYADISTRQIILIHHLFLGKTYFVLGETKSS